MQKNKGASLLMIIVLIALVAIPYFYDRKATTTQETVPVETTKTGNNSSWFNVYTPGAETNPYQAPTPTKQTDTKTPKVTTPVVPVIKEVVDPNQSKYAKKIEISSVNGSSSYAKDEYLTLRNISATDSISITGFTIDTYEKESYRITKGYELPGLPSSTEGNIILKPGDQAVIYVGTQDKNINFRENICTGYLDQFSNFDNRLNHSCPKIDISKRLDFSANCINVLNAIPTCRMFDMKIIVENDCNEFATNHYSYSGCISDFKTRADFDSKKWLIWMQHTVNFFRNDRELVYLKDTEGKIVSTFQY